MDNLVVARGRSQSPPGLGLNQPDIGSLADRPAHCQSDYATADDDRTTVIDSIVMNQIYLKAKVPCSAGQHIPPAQLGWIQSRTLASFPISTRWSPLRTASTIACAASGRRGACNALELLGGPLGILFAIDANIKARIGRNSSLYSAWMHRSPAFRCLPAQHAETQ